VLANHPRYALRFCLATIFFSILLFVPSDEPHAGHSTNLILHTLSEDEQQPMHHYTRPSGSLEALIVRQCPTAFYIALAEMMWGTDN